MIGLSGALAPSSNSHKNSSILRSFLFFEKMKSMSQLEKSFAHQKVIYWQKRWEQAGVFRPKGEGEKFVVAIPPPNITGSLHMGHALNSTLQDVLCRYYRLMGKDVLWLPGTDHAGIATQNVVEKELRRENKSRHDLGRETFLKRVWEWKEKYGNRILEQLRAIGASCDFSRTRFTMDEAYSEAVKTAFVQLYEKGLIFRGERMINFCPRCYTALADIEVNHEQKEGKLWFIAYPLADDEGELVVATTRPETMLGDTAVCVNPHDRRYKQFLGRKVILPLMNRAIPVIADQLVDQNFGTGVLKVTPAHDFKDFELGKTHNLKPIKVITENGVMSEQAGPYKNIERFTAREKIIEDLRQLGLLREIRDYQVPLSTCARCGTVIEPLISKQWFVDAPKLAAPAMEAVRKGEVVFKPERFARFYLEGLSHLREWCISRQIWWGHRIPAWFCENVCPPTVSREEPGRCAHCGSEKIVQDEDVLDTWFSSALWPFAILGWPKETKDLKTYYPTTLLSTARDILFLWVARMVMMSLHFLKTIPFREVIVHPTILNREGRRMSKSLGTGIDPMDLIEKYGADATRLGLMMLMQKGQDVRISEDPIRAARLFCNKLWNAVRLVLLLAEGHKLNLPDPQNADLFGRWILHRLNEVGNDFQDGLEKRHFSDVALKLYHFVWHEWCDWYLEVAKKQIRDARKKEASKKDLLFAETCKNILLFGTKAILQWLHPFIPFLSEELFQALGSQELLAQRKMLHVPGWQFPHECARVRQIFELVQSMRSLKARAPDSEKVFFVEPLTEWAKFEPYAELIKTLAQVSDVQGADSHPLSALTEKRSSYLIYCKLSPNELDKEREKLLREKEALMREKEGMEARLQNPEFVARAKAEIVEETTQKKEALELRLREIQNRLQEIGA